MYVYIYVYIYIYMFTHTSTDHDCGVYFSYIHNQITIFILPIWYNDGMMMHLYYCFKSYLFSICPCSIDIAHSRKTLHMFVNQHLLGGKEKNCRI